MSFCEERPEYNAVEYEKNLIGALARAQFGRDPNELDDSWENEEPWPTADNPDDDVFDPLREESDDNAPRLEKSAEQGYSALRDVMRCRKRRGGSLGGAVHRLGNFAGSDDSDQEEVPGKIGDNRRNSKVRASVSKMKSISPAVSPSKRRSDVLGLSKEFAAKANSPEKTRGSSHSKFIEMMDERIAEVARPSGKSSLHTATSPAKSPAKKIESTKAAEAASIPAQEKATPASKPKGRTGTPKGSKKTSSADECTTTVTLPTTIESQAGQIAEAAVQQLSQQRAARALSKTPKGKTTAATPSSVKSRAKTPKSAAKRPRQALSDDDSGSDRPWTTPKKKGVGSQASRRSSAAVPVSTPTSRRSGLRV